MMWLRRFKLAFVILCTAIGISVAIFAWRSQSEVDLWYGVTTSVRGYVAVASNYCTVQWWTREKSGGKSDNPWFETLPNWHLGRFTFECWAMPRSYWDSPVDLGEESHLWHGFEWRRGGTRYAGPKNLIEVRSPTWFILVITSLPLVITILNRIHRGRLFAAGLCAKCGYDLRATPKRCPECGTVLAK